MEYFLHIKSQLPAVVTIANLSFYLNKIEDSFSVKTTAPAFITYQPTETQFMGAKTLPYIVCFDPKTIAKNPQVQAVFYPENHIEVLLKPNNINLSPLPSQKITVAGHSYAIKTGGGDNSIVEISDRDLVYSHRFSSPLSSFRAKPLGKYIIFEGFGARTNLIVLESSQHDLIQQFSSVVDEIEIKDSVITAIKYNNDIAKQGIKHTINLQKNNFDITKKTIYLSGHPHMTSHSQIIPYAFIEAVQNKNYNLARQYLSRTLSDKLTNKHLDEFFKNLVSIRQNRYLPQHKNAHALIFKTNKTYTAKLYSFNISGGKIDNITEIE